VQVNLDFESENRHGEKIPRRALALPKPITTRAFSPTQPFREGAAQRFFCRTGRRCGTDVDNARAGMLPWVFEDGMSFERYVDYALDVPMYFLYPRGQIYRHGGPKSFRKFSGA